MSDPLTDGRARSHGQVQHPGSTPRARHDRQICTADVAQSGGAPHDSGRRERETRRRLFFRVRVGFLLSVLAIVLARGAIDYMQRQERRAWKRPLEVALVLVEQGSVDGRALSQFEERALVLEEALEAEFSRYGGDYRPFRFRQFGPVSRARVPPRASTSPSLLEPILLSFELGRFAREMDREAGITESRFDGKIYIMLSPPSSDRRALVEGLGEDGGRLALTSVELTEDSVDFGLFVVAHELFHLLGATDRYDADGQTILPDGLAEPNLSPLYPQRGAEVMARGRVLAPGAEIPPDDLDELRVGTQTAAEIGWLEIEQHD